MFNRISAIILLCVAPLLAQAQTLTNLAHPAPDGAQLAFQLTDGSVTVQAYDASSWYRLVPDNTGSYVNGTWSEVAALPSDYSPTAFASAVLADGRLLIEGGEYNFNKFKLTNKGAIYDPVSDTWTKVSPPASWDFIGDSPASVLPDGKFLIGDKLDTRVAQLDPATMIWTELSSNGKNDFNAEEGWTLLHSGEILTVDVKNNPNSERYNVAVGAWSDAGSTVVDLQSPSCCKCIHYGHGQCYHPPGEIGPSILRPDGTVFATGALHAGAAVAHTAVYSQHGSTGAWAPGPDFPNGDDAGDSFAALLPNGHVLVEGTSGKLYEYDGTALTAEPVSGGLACMLLLPTGGVLIDGTAVYKSSGTYKKSWAPKITTFPSTVARGATFQISGTQFNGLSQANAFGDELQTATNYPLVRITNDSSRHVIYARTHDHSSMGVATGKTIVSTNFDVPATAETGPSKLVVVANGIPSPPVAITVN